MAIFTLRSTATLALLLPLMAAACANPPVEAESWQGAAGSGKAGEQAGSSSRSIMGSSGAAAVDGRSSAGTAAATNGGRAMGLANGAAGSSSSAAMTASASSAGRASLGSSGSQAGRVAPGSGSVGGSGAAGSGISGVGNVGGARASSSPAAGGAGAGAGAAGQAAGSGSADDDPFGLGDPIPTNPAGGTRDPNGPCKALMLFCFDPFDMFTLNPECFTCNNGQGCMDCVDFQAI